MESRYSKYFKRVKWSPTCGRKSSFNEKSKLNDTEFPYIPAFSRLVLLREGGNINPYIVMVGKSHQGSVSPGKIIGEMALQMSLVLSARISRIDGIITFLKMASGVNMLTQNMLEKLKGLK